jgi:hypothetical protein
VVINQKKIRTEDPDQAGGSYGGPCLNLCGVMNLNGNCCVLSPWRSPLRL